MTLSPTSSGWLSSLDAPYVTKPSGVRIIHAIEYAVVEGYRPLQIDLYLPPIGSTTDAFPAIVFIHGGGWRVGTRRRFGRAFRPWDPTPLEKMALAGFVVACVDYRLSGEAIFPAQLHDIKAAVRWIRAHALDINIDPDRIVSWGESAGGHLSLMVGLTGNRPDLEGNIGEHLDQRTDVCATIGWYGHTDFLRVTEHQLASSEVDHHAPDSYESLMLGGPIPTRAELASFASPINYVHADAPPIQIHHGDADKLVPLGQSEILAHALEELEAEVELVILPGTDHFWIGAPDINAIFEASLAFAVAKTSPQIP
jgi:acetyl esterase/lipase